MKKLFKKILIPTLVGSTIMPIAGCNRHTYSEEKETSGSIEIISDVNDITVFQTEEHVSEPIRVKCLDKNKKKLSYDLDLKLENNGQLPNWILITDKGEIQVTGGKELGTYSFTLSAHNDSAKLFSKKTFKVNVLDDRHIVPSELKMSMENDQYYQFAESSSIPIIVTPFKEGVEEQYLLNDIKCYVEVITGKATGTDGKDVFTCINDGTKHSLEISNATNESYKGDYELRITAILVADTSIYKSIDITLHIEQTREYYDANSKCTFVRTANQDGWTVDKMDSSSKALRNLPTVIQHRPVNQISENFCSKSNITKLIEIILPTSITQIGDNAFANQTALALIEIPGVKWVGKCAFQNDSVMEYRKAGTKPQFIVVLDNAFDNCKSFKITDQNEMTWIDNKSFMNAGLSTFSIGEKCTYIGAEAFSNCSSLEEFKIYALIPPKIEGGLFNNCDKLSSIKVPIGALTTYKTDKAWPYLGKQIEGI